MGRRTGWRGRLGRRQLRRPLRLRELLARPTQPHRGQGGRRWRRSRKREAMPRGEAAVSRRRGRQREKAEMRAGARARGPRLASPGELPRARGARGGRRVREGGEATAASRLPRGRPGLSCTPTTPTRLPSRCSGAVSPGDQAAPRARATTTAARAAGRGAAARAATGRAPRVTRADSILAERRR